MYYITILNYHHRLFLNFLFIYYWNSWRPINAPSVHHTQNSCTLFQDIHFKLFWLISVGKVYYPSFFDSYPLISFLWRNRYSNGFVILKRRRFSLRKWMCESFLSLPGYQFWGIVSNYCKMFVCRKLANKLIWDRLNYRRCKYLSRNHYWYSLLALNGYRLMVLLLFTL
jgi:hypothetical protein